MTFARWGLPNACKNGDVAFVSDSYKEEVQEWYKTCDFCSMWDSVIVFYIVSHRNWICQKRSMYDCCLLTNSDKTQLYEAGLSLMK